MLSKETESKLSDLFFLIISQENQIELLRYTLSKHKDFDPFSAFQHLDTHSLSSLSPSEFHSILDKHSFHSTTAEIIQLIKQYDSNKNGRLTFNEFLQLVLPSTNPGFRELALSRRGFVSGEVEYLLVKLIQQEILYHRSSEELRRELVTRPDFNILEAFRVIDVTGSSVLDRGSLLRYLGKSKLVLDQEIDALLRRIDNDGDSVINYLEFVDALMPQKNLLNSASPNRLSPERASPLRRSPGERHSSPLRRSPGRQEIISRYSPVKDSYQSPVKTVTLNEIDNRDLSIRRSQVHSHSKSSPYVNESPFKASAEVKELVFSLEEEMKFLRKLESVKNNLCLKHDFNLIDGFRMFDLRDNGFVTLNDIENTLHKVGLRPTHDEVYLLVKHYSRLQDNKLRFSDFSEMLTPREEEYGRIMRNKSALNIAGLDRFRVFARDTVGVLLNCFGLLFEFEILAERQRQRINRLPGFNLFQLFNMLDKDKNGFITANELQDMFNGFRVMVNGKDLQAVVLKFDKNCDGRISYSEFIDEIAPKSSQLY